MVEVVVIYGCIWGGMGIFGEEEFDDGVIVWFGNFWFSIMIGLFEDK